MIKKIEYWWRHAFVYPLLRKLFNNPEVSLPLDIRSIRSILILRYDRIGDMIVTTALLKKLKEIQPNIKIGILASEQNEEIVRNNSCVEMIHVLPKHWWQLWSALRSARSMHYDVILNLIFNRTTTGGILSNIISPQGIKIGQGADKYKFYFNTMLKLDRSSKHMVEILADIINEVFGLKIRYQSLRYNIVIDPDSKETVSRFLQKYNLVAKVHSFENSCSYVLFNLSAHDAVRRLSREQAFKIGEYLGSRPEFKTLLLYAPGDLPMEETARQLNRNTSCILFPEQGCATLLEIASITEGAAFVLTPDTSIIHFASATNTPVVGFYTSMQDVHEWLPIHVHHKIIISEKNKPTSSIAISIIIKEINTFIQTLIKSAQ